jgi:hypothetical protein
MRDVALVIQCISHAVQDAPDLLSAYLTHDALVNAMSQVVTHNHISMSIKSQLMRSLGFKKHCGRLINCLTALNLVATRTKHM